MSEIRFQKTRIVDKWGGIYDSETDKVLSVNDVEHKLNEQQATIRRLQDLCGESDGENARLRQEVNKQQTIIEELKKDNYKRFEKINELKAKLKEKEEDEQLYANEIVKLNKEAKEVLDFKSLGGNY